MRSAAWGDGVGTIRGHDLLEVSFPAPALGEPTGESQLSASVDRTDSLRVVQVRSTRVVVEDLHEPPMSVGGAYLRLHLLSHRLVRPNKINLDGTFGVLPDLCWTSIGPVAVEDLAAVQLQGRVDGTVVEVRSVDKFLRMLDYVLPAGVRIADANRVRLGAHLATGTTVMHEGFVNFNAGTLGAVMVEGRLSQAVVVDDGSDIGGGASTMGTLSGDGTEHVSIGKRCLLGANAGLGVLDTREPLLVSAADCEAKLNGDKLDCSTAALEAELTGP